MKITTVFKKFWEQVDRGGDSECWHWKGLKSQLGYGRFMGDYTHRFSYVLHKGHIPNGMCVCHSCGVPSCVNPKHLWIGSMTENIRDRDRKGRGRGAITKSVLPEVISDIRASFVPYSREKGALSLSKKHNLSLTVVRRILGRTSKRIKLVV